MKNKNYLNCVRYLVGVFMIAFLAVPSVKTFNSPTHRYVTDISLKNISEINKHTRCINKGDEKYWDVISNYSLKPDEDETEGIYKYHFYNPATDENFMGEKISACTKCVEHYNKALDYYKNNDKQKAYEELGRSVHFMEDLNTPVHTGYDLPTDAVFKFPIHVKFEKLCDSVIKQFKYSFPKEDLKYFELNSVESLAKSSSLLSSDNFYCLMDEKNHDQVSIAENAIENAQHNVTGMLYKFFFQLKNK